ncbi:MAG: DUF4147 domain-containing protein [Celeribacter sp.]|jgi:hydroxypyruvate reductase
MARDTRLAQDITDERARATRLFQAGVDAADPEAATKAALARDDIRAACRPDAGGRLLMIAVGKAAMGMARAAQAALAGDVTCQLIVVTNPENADPARLPAGADLHAAAHPVPDAAGLAAGRAVLTALERCGAGDRVLALISGGGSALLPAPVAGLTLDDKAAVSAALLASGADITEMNLVRQQVSRIKGGGLLRAAAPAPVTALILSDVIGDDLSVIASGPTAPPIGDHAQARALLQARGIWDAMSSPVRAHLEQPDLAPDAGPAPVPPARNHLIGANSVSLRAMQDAAPDAQMHATPLIGDVEDAARHVLSLGRGTHLMGGETTVQLRGQGRGGRNQHMALCVALGAEAAGWGENWVFLSGGTDGRDGPTDAAGGIVDAGSLSRMRAAGLDPQALLADNDSYRALAASGDLLMTGGTGTNVADLQVLVRW